eukprot:CAMPEP_0168169594 /NCGR_PEP_ID=MMETSP0139_2-20121125/3723_1 /TAXON_ID=44445 /ORGANISM="Pseudo-nitzschia australis, Strain 10249 10 AB" /LENGTH=683 /DNA_ID=CAMNT_0008087027 /DNA_START=85 /DNA_END=2137 /DNA_ORIENTATION=-
MGDCRIRIAIAKSLFASLPTDDKLASNTSDLNVGDGDDSSPEKISSNESSVSFVRMHSADTTIREVAERNPLLNKLFFGDNASSTSSSSSSSSSLSSSLSKEIEPIAEFTLWDCTLHPPKDITSWPGKDFSDLQGPKSKTLHSAGLFPSGTWIVVPKGMKPNKLSDFDKNPYVDIQYNVANISSNGDSNNSIITNKNNNNGASTRVEFQDPVLRLNSDGKGNRGTPLPSQVMETVANRFAAEEWEEESGRTKSTTESSVAALRRKNLQNRIQKEKERTAKLEKRIAMLEEQLNDSTCNNSKQNKKKKISDQVLRMLVKSRATGDKNLKLLDRLYCQCLVLVDNNNDNDNDHASTNDDNAGSTNATSLDNSGSSKEYRYFSPQDTFAKIANSFQNPLVDEKNQELFSEVLCRRPAESVEVTKAQFLVHRRFPVTMRVYEAISKGYLVVTKKQHNYLDDVLIVRWYKDREDATLDIQHDETITIDDETNTTATGVFDEDEEMISKSGTTQAMTRTPIEVNEEISPAGTDTDVITTFEDRDLKKCIQNMDDLNNKGKKKTSSTKKSSAAALKVRQMKMKSKSKGNKKLKIEDRFFLEAVSISNVGGNPISECCFLSRNDPLERILQYISTGSSTSTQEWQFLIPTEDDSRYRVISDISILVKEAEENRIFKSFDRLILRPGRTDRS